jgi:hypothetical protein
MAKEVVDISACWIIYPFRQKSKSPSTNQTRMHVHARAPEKNVAKDKWEVHNLSKN